MTIILNDRAGIPTFRNALTELVLGADTLSVAVSYLQVGGWELLQQHASGLSLARMRVVCTDQFGITQPAAVHRAISSHVQIRNYAGDVTFHPKIYLAHDSQGQPTRFLISSANLSFAAFTSSVEVGVLGADATGLKTVNDWFNDLFQNRSAQFTPDQLRSMEENWRAAATRRTQARLRVRRGLVIPPGVAPTPLEVEDLDTLEDVFATIQVPIGLLNMDHAGNNVRNIHKVQEVLASWNTIATSGEARSKQRSEMKLLGFAVADGRTLTELGRAAARANNRDEIARLWCKWLQQTPDAQLAEINERLLAAKRVLAQFWQLLPEVREYFLANVENPSERLMLQTIELLCNASGVVHELSLEDIRTLTPLLEQPDRLPEFIRRAIADYQENKGTRGWDYPDRRIVPLAWQTAAGAI